MTEIENQPQDDIYTFINLNPNQKRRWIFVYPERARDMIDYLVNITKDR